VLVELDTAKLTRPGAAFARGAGVCAGAAGADRRHRQGGQAGLARWRKWPACRAARCPRRRTRQRPAPPGARRGREASARATVIRRPGALSTDETNLSKASIRSPIDGVVLTRTVDPGNAVAASLQAVTLFTMAEDLGKLRLEVNVDEADVGAVKVGQKASFTVSAYPRGATRPITRVAFGSTITDNVVTYTTWLEVDNADLSLRPGMTATATITATERKRRAAGAQHRAALHAGSGAVAARPQAAASCPSLMPRMPPRPAGARPVGRARPGQTGLGAAGRPGRGLAVTGGHPRSTAKAPRRSRRSRASTSTSRPASSSPSWAPAARASRPPMNILGCLDTPTTGAYLFKGVRWSADARPARAAAAALPGLRVPGLQPAGAHLGAGERRAAAALPRRPRRARHAAAARRWQAVGLARAGSTTRRPSCRAGSSSAWPSRAPSSPSPRAAGRRAHRQPRHPAQPRDHGPAAALNRDHGITVLMVTHEPDMAAYARRIVRFVDGASPATRPTRTPPRRTPRPPPRKAALMPDAEHPAAGAALHPAQPAALLPDHPGHRDRRQRGDHHGHAGQRRHAWRCRPDFQPGHQPADGAPGQRMGPRRRGGRAAAVQGGRRRGHRQPDRRRRRGGARGRAGVTVVANGRNWSTSVTGSTNDY
jgi:hypothetical protein